MNPPRIWLTRLIVGALFLGGGAAALGVGLGMGRPASYFLVPSRAPLVSG